jgi:hypothetical protein
MSTFRSCHWLQQTAEAHSTDTKRWSFPRGALMLQTKKTGDEIEREKRREVPQ